MSNKMTQETYSFDEARAFLGNVSRQTLLRIIKRGELDSFYMGTQRYLTRKSLEDFITSKRKETEMGNTPKFGDAEIPARIDAEQKEKHRVESHLDGLIKEVERVRMDRTVPEYISQVTELITALRNYGIVPEQPEPVQAKGPDVPF